jgi:DNA-binding SARP family transcriptional activator
MAWYEQAQERFLAERDIAGASRALRAQAAVFLDTVRPIRAESLLQEALRLVDGQPDREERARLLDLMAENMTNRGRWEEADSLRRQARELREEGPVIADLDARVLLRTGCLDQALQLLAERAEDEGEITQDHFRAPRAHRETLLLLSLIYSWQGKADEAISTARRGIEIGSRLGSPFVEAVGCMRLGHAWQITGHPHAAEQALACYEQAMEIGQRLAVARTRIEALWGLCCLFGYQGELDRAERSAHEGIEAGLKVGDEWIAALIGVTLGASYVIANQVEAAERWLSRSAIAYQDLGDPFGQTVAVLWQTLLHRQNHLDDSEEVLRHLGQLLDLVETNNYRFLLERKTFLGPPDPQVLIPLLLATNRHADWLPQHESATRILKGMGLATDLRFYPGYTLQVFALGRFSLLRGQKAVSNSDWPREKARQLFQLLLSERRRFVEREVIISHLWPDAGAKAGERHFRVTLNALHQALEPGRPPRAPTLFVRRRGSTYGIDPDAPLTLDADEFERLVNRGDKAETDELALESYRHALALYQGDFLPDCRYADFCREERARLRQVFLAASTRTGEILLAQGTPAATDEVISTSERALSIDNCWEPAYQHLLRAYLHREDHVQAHRVYDRCVTCLRQELDVSPMPETVALFESISYL